MRSWHAAAIAAFFLVVPAVAQVAAGHPAGFVLTKDIDGDGRSDALIFESTRVHVWFAQAAAPWFVAGPTTVIPHDRRACEPVISGDYLWVASLGPMPSLRGVLEAWRIRPDGTLVPIVAYSMTPAQSNAELISCRIAPLPFDFNNDGPGDVLALWSELPHPAASSMRAAWFSPFASGIVFDLPSLQASMHYHDIVGLHATRNLGQSPGDFLAVISPPPFPGEHAIVFATIARGVFGPVLSAQAVFGMAPPTRLRSTALDERARSVYGAFSPLPMFGAPVVQFLPGSSVAFDGTPLSPFVAPSGQWIRTSIAGALIAGAVADYDADGCDEMVILDHLDGVGDVLVVTDPMPQFRGFQAFWQPSANWLVPHASWPYEITHVAPADVDGDGLLDLVMSLRSTSMTSRIGLFRGFRLAPRAPVQLVRVM